MNAQTQAVLAELKSKGIDTTSIENQIKVNPILDKQADAIIGGGILRQAEFTRLTQGLQQKEEEYKRQIQELASGHDLMANQDQNSELYKALLARTTELEEALIGTGEFTEESVRNVSFAEKKALEEIVNKPVVNPPVKKEDDMPNFDPSKYVDLDTLERANNNLAAGSIMMSMKIARKNEEMRKLGIDVDSIPQGKFDDALVAGMTSGKNLDQIYDEVFNLTAVRETKSKADLDKQLEEARMAGRSEALKEAGIPERKVTRLGQHSILNSKTIKPIADAAKTSSFKDEKGNIDPTKLPVNARGEVERYKLRGSKEDRYNRAAARMGAVIEHYENDPTYVE